MAEIAIGPGIAVRTAAAKMPVAKRKHRGRRTGAMKVIGQAAVVAGISGALVLGVKAIVLAGPTVPPQHGGPDSLGEVLPTGGAANAAAAPGTIGHQTRVASSVALRPAASVTPRVSQATSGASNPVAGPIPAQRSATSDVVEPASQVAQSNTTAAATNPGSVASPGPFGSLADSFATTLDSVVPNIGTVIIQLLQPTTGAVDNTVDPKKPGN
jgi:hypothetical protein